MRKKISTVLFPVLLFTLFMAFSAASSGPLPPYLTLSAQNHRTFPNFSQTLYHVNTSTKFYDNKTLQIQHGEGNESVITQVGTFNNGAESGKKYGVITIQSGENNYSEIDQTGNRNFTLTEQIGNFNASRVQQSGSGNYSTVGQYGNNNYVDIYQAGSKNFCSIKQYLSNNIFSLSQSGGNFVSYTQYGNKSCHIVQTPGAPPISIVQR